jgi:hypothetical protein
MDQMAKPQAAMLVRHMVDLLETIEDCYNKQRMMPCLVLLYSGIDVAASLEPSMGRGVGERFQKWVDRYMLTNGSLSCTAADLYAARCGVVHTFTPDSDLSKAGRAKVMAYTFGGADLAILEKASSLTGKTQQANIHVRTLINAFRMGFGNYISELESDRQRLQEATNSAGLWSVIVSPQMMEQYVESQSESLPNR